MSEQRTHHVPTDGVRIGATVHGDGPPLVLVQGIMGDGELDWQALLPHLTGQFTCHLTNLRGRGLSGDHPDLGFGRQVADLLGYVDSLDGPVALVGWSGGAGLALTAAAESEAVTAVAALEPVVPSLMDEAEQGVVGATIAHVAQLLADDRRTEAARAFAGWPFTDDDIAGAEAAGYFEASGRYVPSLLGTLQQWLAYEGPTVDDPAVLGDIRVPVLVLIGSASKPLSTTSAHHVVDRVPDARLQVVPGAGHAAPLTHPGVIAAALADFFLPR
ncbi:2-hydroxy-6-oxo-6-(2'-aminophenyl)hexa-2,4-dienoic acid hydrolase [Nocardioides dokdonensis FR1436]|uniref:2-hydroxy-6-oxo-6-(2'-aminophenyl)hexa-2, 4-dienoic acid hydrolase n=1 Tax=Nocardioides dokdonensis FR1436 TaxID=1300347 RepID=A0A1A9GJK3_9ACTN|nr:alpha/beta hydrolase [Nocardioides dokdonensis]ANH38448.1 2-hydroxy-6-oxo-6-(2'-aminophenyl)hexa-2,4-dienoic acid hydrolase [Nocardioides dokdonensis FR1436]